MPVATKQYPDEMLERQQVVEAEFHRAWVSPIFLVVVGLSLSFYLMKLASQSSSSFKNLIEPKPWLVPAQMLRIIRSRIKF